MSYNTQTAQEEFNNTGEAWLLQQLSGKIPVKTIFDVGCNQGEWTRMARRSFSSADIHTFEIIPEVYRKFLNNGILDAGIIPNGFGLGEKLGSIPMKYCEENDTYNTHLAMLSPGSVTQSKFVWRDCITVPGDMYMKSQGLEYIDILKIDVEGAEHLVLKGFDEALVMGKIGLIQFEYGTANIVARWLLVDTNEFLSPRNYVFGKLRNGKVDFKPYDLTQEDFIGPNIVAVHRSRTDLLTALDAKV